MELAELQAEHDALLQEAETLVLARANETLRSVLRSDTHNTLLMEGTIRAGDPILTPAQISREVGWGASSVGPYLSLADDYYQGRCRPFYESEGDLQEIRGLGRYLAGADEMAACVLKNLRNYVVGGGAKVTVNAIRGKGGESLAPAVQEFVDEFIADNQLTNHGESRIFLSSVIDGEHLVWLRECGHHAPRIQFVGGEQITEPGDIRGVEDYIGMPGLCWKFGVATDHCDYEKIHGCFVDWYGQHKDWDFIGEECSVLLKRNVTVSKRGISDFYIPFYNIDRAGRLNSSIVKGAIVQASIAGIKKAAQGTPQTALDSALRNRLSSGMSSTVQVSTSGGSTAEVTGDTVLGGRVINTTADYLHGPMGTPQGPVYVEVYQAVARRVGSRWCMPEYMVSGDASNNNRASAEVAESPAMKAFEAEQAWLAKYEDELIWKAIGIAARNGRFGGMQAKEMWPLLELNIEFPDPATRDPLVQEQVFDAQQSAGILSAKTRAAKSELDYDEEIANGAKEKTVPGFDANGVPLPDPNKQPPQLPGPQPTSAIQAAVSEAVLACRTLEEAQAIGRSILEEACGTS